MSVKSLLSCPLLIWSVSSIALQSVPLETSEYPMTVSRVDVAVRTFDSRLATLDHLLGVGLKHLREPDSAYFERRLAPDMLPLGAQVAFTCNQPRNFALWLEGFSADDLDPKVDSLVLARAHLSEI